MCVNERDEVDDKKKGLGIHVCVCVYVWVSCLWSSK